MHISQMLEQASLEELGKEKKDEVEVFLSNPTLIQSMSKSLACIYEGGGGGITREENCKISYLDIGVLVKSLFTIYLRFLTTTRGHDMKNSKKLID